MGHVMTDSGYRVTELGGFSIESCETAARNAIEIASKRLRNLRIV